MGLIKVNRTDRLPLWDVVTSQVAQGHTVNWYYLCLALFESNEVAVKELLARGWAVNGPPWARFMTPLDLAKRLNARSSIAILKDHGATSSIFHQDQGKLLFFFLYPAVYLVVIPNIFIFATPIPNLSQGQTAGRAYLYSLTAMTSVPLPYFFTVKWLWGRPKSHFYTWFLRYLVAPLAFAWYNVGQPILIYHNLLARDTVRAEIFLLSWAPAIACLICYMG